MITSWLVPMDVFSAHNVIPLSTWGRSAYQTEEEKSGSEYSEDEEMRHDELEEFRNTNADCASGDVTFFDDSGETMVTEQSPATTFAANTSGNTAKGDQNEIEVR